MSGKTLFILKGGIGYGKAGLQEMRLFRVLQQERDKHCERLRDILGMIKNKVLF